MILTDKLKNSFHCDLGFLNIRAGSSIADDFHGYMDINTKGMVLKDHMNYFHNNGDGAFRNRTSQSGLQDMAGGA